MFIYVEINLSCFPDWYTNFFKDTIEEALQKEERLLGVEYIVGKVEEFIRARPSLKGAPKTVFSGYINNFSLYLCGIMDAKREALENDKTKTA